MLATAGNNHLGGDDFDARLADWVVGEFKQSNHVDLSRDATAMQRVREACEAAKRELSSTTSTTINLPYITTKGGQPLHLELQVTRAQFEKMCADLVNATLGPCRQAIADSGLNTIDIGKVLMVGGSSRIPCVQAAVKKLTDATPCTASTLTKAWPWAHVCKQVCWAARWAA